MKIKTKYNLGQTVYLMKDNNIYNFKIGFIEVLVRRNSIFKKTNIKYGSNGLDCFYNEQELFISKKELKKTL